MYGPCESEVRSRVFDSRLRLRERGALGTTGKLDDHLLNERGDCVWVKAARTEVTVNSPALIVLGRVSFTRFGALGARTPEHAESAAKKKSLSQDDLFWWRVVSTDTPTSMLPGISRKRKMRSKF